MQRRDFVKATTAAALSASWQLTSADDFPSRPIQVVVPYAAGGADTFIRPLQAALASRHGIRLVIDTVVGSGGTIGAGKIKNSPADGYSLLFCGTGAMTIAPNMQSTPSVGPADFTPIVNLIKIPYFIAVKKGSPFADIQQLIAFMKANPGKLNYGSPGNGSAPHLGMESVTRALGTSATHVPFTGIATAMTSLLGGHIDAVVGAPGNVMAQVDAGNINALAVIAKDRFALTPNVPALGELGLDIDVSTHFGFFAPKGVSQTVVSKLAAAITDVASDPAYKKIMETARTGVYVIPGNALSQIVMTEQARFAPLIEEVKKAAKK